MTEAIIAIIMALISYFTTKKKTNGNEAAALGAAALAGFGTYYVATETEWGRDSVAFLDDLFTGDDIPTTAGEGQVVTPGGAVVPAGGTVTGSKGFWDSLSDTLKSWGPLGTAAVVGVGGATLSSSIPSWMKWAGLGLLVYMIVK